MKQIVCSQMGGPADCTFMVPGNSVEEMSQNAMKHVEEAHPDLAAKIKQMSPEETGKWMEDLKAKFAAAPNM